MLGRRKLVPPLSEPAQPFGGKRFLCRPLVTARIDSLSRLVRAPASKSVGVIENDLLALAERLQSWATFEEHLAELESAGLALTGHELTSALERLQQLGALWFAEDFLETLARQAPARSAPIGTMVWCTRDRPHVLARSIESFLAAGRDAGPARLLVCDDSTDPKTSRRTAAALQDAGGGSRFLPGSRVHVGAQEKRRIIASLQEAGSAEGISPDVVEFALGNRPHLPNSEGANRNFSLLLTAGEAFLSTDDDTLSVGAFGDSPDRLELSSAFNPTVTDFFASDEECSATVPARDCPIFAEHQRFLGRGVGEVGKEFESGGVLLSSCGTGLARDLVSNSGTVLLTSAGVLGDSGFANPRMIFHLEGERRERYVEDTGAYRSARLSRVVFRRTNGPAITNSPWLVTLNYAVDNRDFIPPTFPFGRNADGLLGLLLRACRPDGYFLHLPFGVRHIPPAARTFSESDLHGFIPRVCDFLIHSTQSAGLSPLARSPADRVSALASHYRALGRLSPKDFEEVVRSTWMSFADRYVSNLQMRLDEHGYAPEPWAADVEQHVQSMQAFLRQPTPLVPREFAAPAQPAIDPEDQLGSFRRSIELFGDTLDAWPTLREMARRRPLI